MEDGKQGTGKRRMKSVRVSWQIRDQSLMYSTQRTFGIFCVNLRRNIFVGYKRIGVVEVATKYVEKTTISIGLRPLE